MRPFSLSIPSPPTRDGNDWDRSVKSRLDAILPARLPGYTVQELNTLDAREYDGYLVRCTNGNSGAECLAFCNGRTWNVIELGSVIAYV